ncbi:MAG: conjugal transfer protein TraF [Elusimicrobiales bacterium]
MKAHAAFSNSPCGARATAMGGAFTAIAGGAEAACTNPAALVETASPELTAVYGRLYSGLSDDSSIGQGYFGFAMPVKKYLPGAAAFSWSDLRLSEAYSESAYSVSYATHVYRGVNAGLSLKYLRRGYVSDAYTAVDPVFADGYSKGALGADLGLFWRPEPRYAVGLTIKNLNKPDLGLASSDPLPVEVRAGVSYAVKSSLLDFDAAFADSDYTLSAGAEYLFQRRYALRMGLSAGNDSRRSVNLGLGGRFGLAEFNYAFSLPIGGIAGTIGSHLLAFSFRFGQEPVTAADQASSAAAAAAAADLKRAEEKISLQGEKIRALQDKLDAMVRQGAEQARPAAQTAVVPAQIPAPQGSEVSRGEMDSLRVELEKAKAEMEALKRAKAAQPAVKPAGPSGPAVPARRTYVVKDGDTLQSIASSVYGDPDRWPEIYRANAGSLGRGGEVKAGQVLVLP